MWNDNIELWWYDWLLYSISLVDINLAWALLWSQLTSCQCHEWLIRRIITQVGWCFGLFVGGFCAAAGVFCPDLSHAPPGWSQTARIYAALLLWLNKDGAWVWRSDALSCTWGPPPCHSKSAPLLRSGHCGSCPLLAVETYYLMQVPIVGKLLYLTITHPDLSLIQSTFSHNLWTNRGPHILLHVTEFFVT